ncbi:hypothetical protein FFI39_009290 [Janthinobacterium sp. KBS0711]|uniref:hypothetical protein n=1 Tax=Janthinobacterium sp. KBS0711 TaxID=1649647 RepID=UPI00110DD8A6|nr:hypothetical protein [Janthinobacterium sp. KBS0711]TSD71171.1 hypothetical protein FFI39_009290 [Janthinobacterium sp. KBS0711]
MKIMSCKVKLYHQRKQIRANRLLIRAAGMLRNVEYVRLLEKSRRRRPVRILAPAYLILNDDNHRENLVVFLRDLERELKSGFKVIIDFSPTIKLHPCGTLYLIANLDEFLAEYPGSLSCKLPKDNVVEQLFQHVGLLSKLGRASRLAVTASNVVNWHYATGSDATTNTFKALLMQHGDAMGGILIRSNLYDCMSEAVTNTKKHAYPKAIGSLNNWWMFSQASGDILQVAICDLGIGIPRSLLEKPEMKDYFRKLFMIGRQSSHDKTLIKIASSTNRSSTGLEYRGKGLPQMLDFIKNQDNGGFRAQSGSGSYTYNAFSKRQKEVTHKQSIKGTLVQWTLKLKS